MAPDFVIGKACTELHEWGISMSGDSENPRHATLVEEARGALAVTHACKLI